VFLSPLSKRSEDEEDPMVSERSTVAGWFGLTTRVRPFFSRIFFEVSFFCERRTFCLFGFFFLLFDLEYVNFEYTNFHRLYLCCSLLLSIYKWRRYQFQYNLKNLANSIHQHCEFWLCFCSCEKDKKRNW
jgi:hypothetical protein